MKKILDGIIEFKKNDFEQYKNLFSNISKKQKPHILFIGCSDSRIVPNLITKTLPGELFMIRNIANLVPIYRESEELLATTSAIEYAIQLLNIENIIICGHSNCGGCAALYQPDDFFKSIPHTKKWLHLASNVKKFVLSQTENEEDGTREWLTEQNNVVEQMKHLLTYPFIREKYENNKLTIQGWYYIIETGDIYCYDSEKKIFTKIN